MTEPSASSLPHFDFCLEHDAFGRLVLVEANGARHAGVEPVRAFPISAPEQGLSITDAEGRELFWIDDLRRLPAPLRATLEQELAKHEFVPKIVRIIRTSAQTHPCEWEVETDRGPTTFLVKSEDSIRRLNARQALVTDAHGVRYLIADTQSLDRTTRRILERYL